MDARTSLFPEPHWHDQHWPGAGLTNVTRLTKVNKAYYRIEKPACYALPNFSCCHRLTQLVSVVEFKVSVWVQSREITSQEQSAPLSMGLSQDARTSLFPEHHWRDQRQPGLGNQLIRAYRKAGYLTMVIAGYIPANSQLATAIATIVKSLSIGK